MHRSLIMLSIVTLACFAHAHAWADEPFECIAHKEGVAYTVKLTGASDHRSMTVLDSRGSTTSGRAIVYRRGTRFYLKGERQAGFKLGMDGESASLCFENGGRDCYACEPIASRRERYIVKEVCVTTTPRGRYTATLYSSGEPTGELVLEDAVGEIASGPVRIGVIGETVRLSIGPSEGYAYTPDAGLLCTTDLDKCYVCEERWHEIRPKARKLPRTEVATCSTPIYEVKLIEQGGDYFMTARLSVFQLVGGRSAAPAFYLGGGRWISDLDDITVSSGDGSCTFTADL